MDATAFKLTVLSNDRIILKVFFLNISRNMAVKNINDALTKTNHTFVYEEQKPVTAKLSFHELLTLEFRPDCLFYSKFSPVHLSQKMLPFLFYFLFPRAFLNESNS